MKKTGKCCICDGSYEMYGNNPYPLDTRPEARCCHDCNNKVVAARLLWNRHQAEILHIADSLRSARAEAMAAYKGNL